MTFYSKEELSLSFIYLYRGWLLNSYFIRSVPILYSHYIFWCSDCPRFGHWEHLQDVLCILLICAHHLLSTFWSFGMRWSRFILFCVPPHSCPVPVLELTISPRSPDSTEWRMVFTNQDLSTRRPHNCKLLKASVSLFYKWLFSPVPLHVILFLLISCYFPAFGFIVYTYNTMCICLYWKHWLPRSLYFWKDFNYLRFWAVQGLPDFIWYLSYLGYCYPFFPSLISIK